MIKNPKLSVYKVILQQSARTKKNSYSFREFFINKYQLKETSSDNKIFNSFFSDVFKILDYKDDKKRRKAFRLSENITKKSNSFIVHGVVEGGPYDSGKSSGNLQTKRRSVKLHRNFIIQDDFYFLLQTKLDEKVGILILQTYGQENIDDSFKKFIKQLFRHKGQTFNAVISPFIPESIKELSKETAIVSELNYQSNKVVINQVSEDGKDKLGATFKLKITLTPVDEGVPLPSLAKWRNLLGNSILNLPNKEMTLKDFNSKTGYIKSPTLKNPARFEIDQDVVKIKPTIYLEKIDEVTIEENGVPEWESLKRYCIENLLPVLETEIYG